MKMKIDLQSLKSSREHFPVMIQEVLEHLELENNGEAKTYLDCTFGGGGYSSFILGFKNTRVIACDRDSSVERFARGLSEEYGDRFEFNLVKFSEYPRILDRLGIKVDGIVMDLGFSSMQIVDSSRGFSFKREGRLSMEMGLNSMSAYDLVNGGKEGLLADIIYYYGEERMAKQIAKRIVSVRGGKKIETTLELADIVRGVCGGRGRIDSATKTFQAIRIYVNDELGELQRGLKSSVEYLKVGGKLVVVSFHSLEDRIVKEFLRGEGFFDNGGGEAAEGVKFRICTKKPVVAKEEEFRVNPPSSSAKLRVAERL